MAEVNSATRLCLVGVDNKLNDQALNVIIDCADDEGFHVDNSFNRRTDQLHLIKPRCAASTAPTVVFFTVIISRVR